MRWRIRKLCLMLCTDIGLMMDLTAATTFSFLSDSRSVLLYLESRATSKGLASSATTLSSMANSLVSQPQLG